MNHEQKRAEVDFIIGSVEALQELPQVIEVLTANGYQYEPGGSFTDIDDETAEQLINLLF